MKKIIFSQSGRITLIDGPYAKGVSVIYTSPDGVDDFPAKEENADLVDEKTWTGWKSKLKKDVNIKKEILKKLTHKL